MTADLFDDVEQPWVEPLEDGAQVLRRFASARAPALLDAIIRVTEQAPLRQMKTPGGHTMSAAMACCGTWGWVTDRKGYRYQQTDPLTDKRWPGMPEILRALAREAAEQAGYPDFEPDACLINRYLPGAKMALHQDKDETDFSQPIVSVSLGSPIVFQFGGDRRSDRPRKVPLEHGDVVVWGGPSRLRYHGVLTLKPFDHPLTGACRYNLTFRRAG
ncbi:DNA oxidative demethylase AlkB [Marinobacter confluentis]|uniref:DNA oxidative demethylase AlkB n=1 Tax=Marinobacter confluentis TaxID=1697557 RepID=A0A4Z1BSZ2_9GAMM|nr:DNA oxidative demethylase AlkB [Marinobacter confluentis]TGN41145.1 DNA oxidative demethylase AlkB [Marinobacter confluentis]